MKKVFTILAAALTSLSMSATTGLWRFSGGNAPAVNSEETGTNIKVEFLTTDASKTFANESAAYNEAVPADLKSQGSKGLKLGANALYLKVTPTVEGGKFAKGDTLYICGYLPWKISSTSAQSGDVAASLATGTSKTDYNVGYVVFNEDATELYLTRAQGNSTCIAAIKIAEFVDPGTPSLNADKKSLDLRIARTTAELKKDSFVLSGRHLDKIAELSLTFPEHAGLTISSTTISPESDGSLSQKFIVTYAPTVEEDEFEGNIVVKADEIEFNIAVSCNKKERQETLVPVENSISWDFAATGLTESAIPYDTNDTIIFINVVEGWAEDFAADKIAGHGQYFFYKDNDCFQGLVLEFVTSVSGKLTIVFSNTGTSDRPNRRLFVNGVDTGNKSKNTTPVTVENIAVEKGRVSMYGMMEDKDAPEDDSKLTPNMLRIYKVIFTKDGETAVENTEVGVKAVKTIENGQLVIIKNGVKYSAQGAVLK